MKYKTVCLCGSMKFYSWMLEVAETETLKGNIILMPFVRKDDYMTDSTRDLQHKVEQALPDGESIATFLDAMHRAKIDMSDEILVCSNRVGYIGESTNAEIQYAATNLKSIRFALDPETARQ